MLLFAALTVVLTVALARELRENRRLRQDLLAMATAKARAAGITPGQVLEPFTLRDAAGQEARIDFAGCAGTVLLFHAAHCEACAFSSPHWRSAVEQAARPDVRVLPIQTDVDEGGPQALEGLPASLVVPRPPLGWLAALPVVPATLVVDEHGAVVKAWFGEIDPVTEQELANAIAELPAMEAAAR
jgi:peroxiredoxin